ncbi:MAG: histidine kinase [Melioribacteraceae bacterium]|nr:histidine kinase [Melioribacteraceae bacterium]
MIYWICQIFGWSIYLSLGLIISSNSNIDTLKWFPVMFIKTSLLLFMTHRLRNYIIKTDLLNLPTRKIIFTVVIAVVIISATANIVTSILMLQPFELITWEQYSVKALFYYFLNECFIVAVWLSIYFVAAFIKKNRVREIEKLQLEVIARESQMDSLKAQINPHFIFNSLNNIRSLIFENPKKAGDMITHLSDLLRYSIKHNDSGKETIQHELNVVKDYLKLQSIHLEERLNYSIYVDENLLNVKVPSMSIQLLVENAVKHGVLDLLDGGSININIYNMDENAIIEISNTGEIIEKSQNTKIGIKNVSDRLRLMFGSNAQLTLSQTKKNLVTAKFNVPLN